MKKNKRIVGTIACLLLCSTMSWAGLFSVSISEQKKLGAQAAQEIEKKEKIVGRDVEAPRIHGRGIDEIVREVGNDLVAAVGTTPWEFSFKVIHNKEINAFAVPGGYIYIYTGLLQSLKMDAGDYQQGLNMLAGVLGHEIIHVTEQHWAKQYKKDMERGVGLALILGATGASKSARQIAGIMNYAQSQKYSRKDEYKADEGAINLAHKSGKYDPQGTVDMLRVLDKAGRDTPKAMVWLSSHPLTRDRIARAEKKVAEIKGQTATQCGAVPPN